MSDVLHATWLPALTRLFVWGEAADAPPRRGRKATLPVHPLQSSPERLRAALPTRAAARADEQTLTFWLPTAAGAPLPSPELVATGAATVQEGSPTLAAWRVTGLLLPVDPALDLLLAPPPVAALLDYF